ncbi:hypothetical protein IAU60_005907 [Kwoniella sp. DSM 27419]
MRSLRPVEQQWLFQPSTLLSTPSSQDGIPLTQELEKRRQVIGYMRSLALRVNHLQSGTYDTSAAHLRGSMITGATLVHRFYMRRSFKDFPEEVVAATILFLACKIEEEPLKLRHIVNCCIAKFDPNARGWHPDRDPQEQPSREYREWEKEILALEEIVLEATCFDMGIEQPWVVLARAVKGLDARLAQVNAASASASGSSKEGRIQGQNGHTPENGKGKGRETISENLVVELGWTVLSESSITPLSVIYPTPVIAYVAFILVLAMILQIPLSNARASASELADRFGLGITWGDDGPGGQEADLDSVDACLSAVIGHINDGLIDQGIARYIVPEPEQASKQEQETPVSSSGADVRAARYTRRFTVSPADETQAPPPTSDPGLGATSSQRQGQEVLGTSSNGSSGSNTVPGLSAVGTAGEPPQSANEPTPPSISTAVTPPGGEELAL